MRALQIQTALAALGLLLALGVRHRSAEAPRTQGAVLVECAVRALRMESPGRTVRVVRRGEDVAVEVVRGEERARFVGGLEASELLDQVGDLRAIRTLEEATEDYGFGEESLFVACTDEEQPRVLAVGDTVYGSEDRYVKDESGVVHLAEGALFERLASAEVVLMRRRLHSFEEEDLDRVEVAFPDGVRVGLTQRFGADPNRRRWVDAENPERQVPGFDRLMGAHRNLRAEAGAEAPSAADSGAVEPLATLTFLDEDGATLGTLRVRRTGSEPRAAILAHTEHVGWVSLPRSTGVAFARALERLHQRRAAPRREPPEPAPEPRRGGAPE